jgi:hypothetical protein
MALLGYQEYATASALRTIAWMLQERDAEIAMLREELRGLQAVAPPPPPGVAAEPETPEAAGPAAAAEPQA